MKRWEMAVQKAKDCLEIAKEEVEKSAKLLAKSLGFKNYDKFSATMAGNGSTIFVGFYECGYDLELDIEIMSEMSKQQIIDEFETSEECMLVMKEMY